MGRVENLMRSAGVATNLTYKPDIFSALGIYRNNKWGFRPTIYHSRVMVMEGRSKVEVVGTSKWYHNSSKGLHHPPENKETSVGRKQGEFPSEDVRLKNCKKEEVIEVKAGTPVKEVVKGNKDESLRSKALEQEPIAQHEDALLADENGKEAVKCFAMENMDSLKHLSKEQEVGVLENDQNLAMSNRKENKLAMFDMKEMEAMKEVNEPESKEVKGLEEKVGNRNVTGIHKSNADADFNDIQNAASVEREVVVAAGEVEAGGG